MAASATPQLLSRCTYGVNVKVLVEFIPEVLQSQNVQKTRTLTSTLRSVSLRFKIIKDF